MFLRKNKVSIIAIYEHRVKEERSRNILNKIMPSCEWCTNATTQRRGKIWVAWDPNKVRYQVTNTATQYIHGTMQLRNGIEIQFTAIYRLHIINPRRP